MYRTLYFRRDDGSKVNRYFVFDTVAELLTSTLIIGDLAYTVDTGGYYVASSTTTWQPITAGATPGTVTNVSVVTANGVSGSVANPTTTPAITLTLGAITPSSLTISSLTTGSLLFIGAAGAVTEDNANLFWDNTNNFFGIGTNAPLTPFFLKGINYSGNFTKLQDGSAFTGTSVIENTINLNTTNTLILNYTEGLVDFASDPGVRTVRAEDSQINVVSTNSTGMTSVALVGGAHTANYAGTGGIGTITGVIGTATNSGSGASGNLIGGSFITTISGSAGTIVNATANTNVATLSGTSTITTFVGSNSATTVSGAGTVTSVLGTIGSATVSNASAVVTSIVGMQPTGTLSAAATVANILATNSTAQVTAAGIVTSLEGTRTRWVNSGAATVTSARAFFIFSWGNTVGAGVITNAYGLQIGAITNTGTMTNTYGIRVDSMTGAGTHTNNPYGIYQSGTTDYNYFAGASAIGGTSAIPLSGLDIITTTFTQNIPHQRLVPRTNSVTPMVGAIESTGNDLSYTINGGTRKTVTYKEDLVNDKTVTERVRISGEEMVFTNVIQTGTKLFIQIPYNASITSVTALADQSGSIVVDIYKQPYATFSPTLATYTATKLNQAPIEFDSRWLRSKAGRGNFTPYRDNTITAATTKVLFVNWAFNPFVTSTTPITLASTTKYQDTTLSGWDTQIKAGDILCFVVNSVTTITRLDISLTLLKV